MSDQALTKIPVETREEPTTLSLIRGAMESGLTAETVGVVERLVQLRREEVSAANKTEFNKAFFQLKKEIATMELYADKAAKTDGGSIAYRYCSEGEIAKMLEPVLLRHGFAMFAGQSQESDKVTVEITLIHESGHEEKRQYTVRSGNTNRMKDATAADTGATTSAWRHLAIKLFGLKSRMREGDDPRNLGETITKDQAFELEDRIALVNGDKAKFLKLAGSATFAAIPSAKHEVLDQLLREKESKK
jgi:hypothetical protein